MQDYKFLCVAMVTICATLVTIQADTHTQTAFRPAYINSSARWAKNKCCCGL